MKRPPNTDVESASSGSKRRRRISSSEDEDLRTTSNSGFTENPPLHKIYNSSSRKEKPDELFRKDLISAMKLPDNEQLDDTEFWDVTDSWKQEWERGVQVPVNIKNVPNPEVRIIGGKTKSPAFKLPKKLIRTKEDNFFSSEIHVLSDTAKKCESICKYDLDDLDFEWLQLLNERRDDLGLSLVTENTMEKVLEDFETQCSNRFQDAIKNEKGLGIEYDEGVLCDVCRSPDCEEGNEMVFCDSCNICVHQACYGITAIPEGSWICRPCALNIKPPCILCPNNGGAMKSTSSGEKWAHVNCALWIPEVVIGCPEKMEPIMRISHIPTSRWALICSLCRERVGACIQCSVKQCKVAYHVTCGFEHGLEMEMKTTPIDSNEEGVKMQSFCHKHSKKDIPVEKIPTTKSPKKFRKKKEPKNKDVETEVNEVDAHNARLQKIRSLEAQFHKFVNVKDTAEELNADYDVVDFLYYYWVLKRRAQFNKPLLIAKCDEANLLLIKQHENLLYSRLKMFVHLRQDLERVRNLCYMVSRREKIFRSYVRMKTNIYEKQTEILSDLSLTLSPEEITEVLKARVGDSLYDQFYCVVFDDDKKDVETSGITCDEKPAKTAVNSIFTRSRRRTISQSTPEYNAEDGDADMPKLTKYKSEENVSSFEKRNIPQSLTHSPFVIKITPKVEVGEMKIKIKEEVENICNGATEIAKDFCEDKVLKTEPNDFEIFKSNSENANLKSKKMMNTSETSNDKNSLCLSDKENISAHAPVKMKKTRSSQIEFKNAIHEIAAQKVDLFDDDSSLSVSSDLNNSDVKKNFKLDKRNTRYQMRTRNYSSDVLETDDISLKSTDSVNAQITLPCSESALCPPANSIEELTFLSNAHDMTELECKSIDVSPRKRRGRPRKTPLSEVSETTFPVIKSEVSDSSKGISFDAELELADLNEGTGFRMSLRTNREHLNNKTNDPRPKNKRSVVNKLDLIDSSPLKEANKEILTESSQWTSVDTSPSKNSSVDQPQSRIIIRLRKDPNRESWKNSSSSDEPAFTIVNNEEISEENIKFSPDNDNRHRYLMRERTIPPRSVKCTFRRS
ncbi:protein Jade-1-like [Uloborus diversus]|uniref:protein Jade-1-like n=1 Tax=Uloborus diversus TaxID=327109 RepID=UPI00240A528F|nr:protein Jade-1-like [Uloborus diversus]